MIGGGLISGGLHELFGGNFADGFMIGAVGAVVSMTIRDAAKTMEGKEGQGAQSDKRQQEWAQKYRIYKALGIDAYFEGIGPTFVSDININYVQAKPPLLKMFGLYGKAYCEAIKTDYEVKEFQQKRFRQNGIEPPKFTKRQIELQNKIRYSYEHCRKLYPEMFP